MKNNFFHVKLDLVAFRRRKRLGIYPTHLEVNSNFKIRRDNGTAVSRSVAELTAKVIDKSFLCNVTNWTMETFEPITA